MNPIQKAREYVANSAMTSEAEQLLAEVLDYFRSTTDQFIRERMTTMGLLIETGEQLDDVATNIEACREDKEIRTVLLIATTDEALASDLRSGKFTLPDAVFRGGIFTLGFGNPPEEILRDLEQEPHNQGGNGSPGN